MSEIINETQQDIIALKAIIKQAKSSGKMAWKAGKLLSNIIEKKSYKPNYDFFADYVKSELDIELDTAFTYIEISEKFTEDEVENLIISTLKAFLTIKNVEQRKRIMQTFMKQDRESYTVNDVITTVAIAQSTFGKENKFSEQEIQTILQDTIKKRRIAEERRKESKPQKFGKELESKAFQDIRYLFAYEPIHEMGVVSLFSVLLQILSHIPFKHPLFKDDIILKRIKYIQIAFPDACVYSSILDLKGTQTEINIEFEFYSTEYLTHQHHKSPKHKECHLVVCWEDNLNSKAKNENRLVPPILELKDFLETGQIILK